jgi:pimeloyl-ACP methyl ester carboxylesterase
MRDVNLPRASTLLQTAGRVLDDAMADEVQLLGPTSHYFYSQRLKLHYVDWGNPDKPPLLLVHGGRDHCRSWDRVAADLRRSFHVIAPDLRGHGDSAWAIGSTYSMIDYVLDVAALLKTLDLFPITIVAHSLGASVALQYSGIYPDRVARLVAIEGLGPPPGFEKPTSAAARMLQWVREMQALARRHPKPYATLEEAAARMLEANPHLTHDLAWHLTVSGVIRHEDGTYSWKFDNFVRAVSPYLFNLDEAREIWSHITCPVLLVRGRESWAPDPEADGRAAAFRNARLVTVERAGHWVHHDQLAVFLQEVRRFLESA